MPARKAVRRWSGGAGRRSSASSPGARTACGYAAPSGRPSATTSPGRCSRRRLGGPTDSPASQPQRHHQPQRPTDSASTVELGAESSRLINGDLIAEISASGQLRFLRADGRELLAETTPHFTGPPTRRYKTTGGGTHHFEVLFDARDGERFYGLGQHQHGRLDQKGAVVELVQRNTEVSIPFLVSSRGYGLLWNTPGSAGSSWARP